MSTIPRLYVTADPLSEGSSIELDEGQSKYITRVMRLGTGESVRVFNGRDGEWETVITAIEGRSARLQARQRLRKQPQSPETRLTLLFAPLKKTQTDFVIEKATELGASRICPVITERTQTRRVRTSRLQKIAIEAAEQTERLDLPGIEEAKTLQASLQDMTGDTALIFCDEAGDKDGAPWGGSRGRGEPIMDIIAELESPCAAILIGPEGGFSPQERHFLRARPGTYAVSLGPRILRAETAAICALTLWQAQKGDWKK